MTAPATIVWTGDEAEFRRFADAHADEFAWGFAALDDGRADRTVIEVWPHAAEPWAPQFARPGDIVTADGCVMPAPAAGAGRLSRAVRHPLVLVALIVVAVLAAALCVADGHWLGTAFAAGAAVFGVWAIGACRRYDRIVAGGAA